MTPSGTLTTLYSFCSQTNCTDGSGPSGLVQATNGDFYGTTEYGGANQNTGTLFKITPSGTLTTLYSFCAQSGCTDGNGPNAGLVQATNGNFYGTTVNGGANSAITGTLFKITPSGTLTTLYSFCAQSGCTDGSYPIAALIQATNGDFYGTTSSRPGATFGGGTVFKITPSGTLTTLYSFCAPKSGCTDGSYPIAALVQATDGNFYGTTQKGGNALTLPVIRLAASSPAKVLGGLGTVFSLSDGLAPFAGLEPRFGKVGTVVRILGQGFTGSTSVTFNGTAAVFTVVSDTYIKTSVPTGATTGKVVVVTPTGTLSSGGNFRVK
jgi:uncharacterized repeat protein (TIGR03803 family)